MCFGYFATSVIESMINFPANWHRGAAGSACDRLLQAEKLRQPTGLRSDGLWSAVKMRRARRVHRSHVLG
jgi:hypothetical protein